ncbi:MAG: UDP-N-acetylmuramoyl-tripeptide--D-alanyl-D-alanine ligase [Oscillospiraceae bacterium]
MEYLLTIILLAAFATAFAVNSLYYIHMFQLNSYKMKCQLIWLGKNFAKTVLLRNIWALAVIPLVAFCGSIGKIISIVIFLALAFFNLPKKAKKPLVFTMRVKRMLITLIILLLAVIIVLFFAKSPLFFGIVLGLKFLFIPIIVLLANIINKPIELSINRYYINDAKRIIKEMPNLTVIGVTGSYGKTSVKFYLNKLLSAKYSVLMTPESYNTTLGVVKTIRTSLRATHEIFICEMGAKNIGDIKEICDIVCPKYGIITSIGPQHLESFKTIENVVKTKFELADAISDGIVFLNMDNDFIFDNKIDKTVVGYGIEKQKRCSYFADQINVSSSGSTFKLMLKSGEIRTFSTKLIGTHNVQNIVGAIAVSHKLGVSLDDIAIQVRRLESVPHRLQLIKGGNALIIDDAYNSNPSGAKAALDTLNCFDGMKILVTPGMIELGSKQFECNKTFGEQAAAVCDFVALVGEVQTKPIYDGLLAKNYSAEKIYVAENLKDALDKVSSLKTGGQEKVVLLENDLPDNY